MILLVEEKKILHSDIHNPEQVKPGSEKNRT